jgi:hypothetical protein
MAISLRMASLALPADCFVRALDTLDPKVHAGIWASSLADFAETVRLRRDLAKEIVP